MARTINKLTIVAPFFNEETNVTVFYDALRTHLDPLNLALGFVFVDDGSSDHTLRALQALAHADSRVQVIALSRNFGHQLALTAGLDFADGDVIVSLDSDMQHPPSFIPQMLAHYHAGADVVYAVRAANENVGPIKRITSDGYYRVLSQATETPVIRGASDFRLMAGHVLRHLQQLREQHRYLRGMIPWMGYPYAVIPYPQGERHSGTSKYTLRKMMRLARHGLFSFSTVPLTMITWAGFGLAGLALLYLLFVLVVWAQGIALEGWTSIVFGMMLIGAVQLISLGVIAQYIGMIFEQSKGRPLYLIRPDESIIHSQPAPPEESAAR